MAHLNKIAPTSPSRARPSELETDISKALYDLQTNIPDMKTALRPLQFVSAREVRLLLSTAPFIFSVEALASLAKRVDNKDRIAVAYGA